MKLWDKGYNLNKKIEKFTVGNDFLLDQKLVKYDCEVSIAHAKMLCKIGVLTKHELKKAVKGLNEVIVLNSKSKFIITQEQEDCHTAIENYLTKKYGNVGKKIHTGKSRNDQVLAALLLWTKSELSAVKLLLNSLKRGIDALIKKYGNVNLPGYTHMQKAMPTTVKNWFNSYISSIEDDIYMLGFAMNYIDKSPLGSAAGFGVPIIKIDKKMTANLLGFKRTIEPPNYVQTMRAKFTSEILNLLSQIMFSINKMSTDLLTFSMDEFGYFKLPKEFCTGSSIMPNKKNPDVLELLHAKYHIVLGNEFKVKSLIANLSSGYNRDMQLTKEPLFNSMEITKDCLEVMSLLISKLEVNKEKCEKAMISELYATEQLYKLLKKGKSFREAYKDIANNFK